MNSFEDRALQKQNSAWRLAAVCIQSFDANKGKCAPALQPNKQNNLVKSCDFIIYFLHLDWVVTYFVFECGNFFVNFAYDWYSILTLFKFLHGISDILST